MSDPLRIAQTAQRTQATVADETVFHYIGDDELDRLADMPTDPAKDICLLTLGAFLSALLPAAQALLALGHGRVPGASDLIALLVAAITGATAASCALFWHRRVRHVADLRAAIRNRKRVPVVFEQGKPPVLLSYPDAS